MFRIALLKGQEAYIIVIRETSRCHGLEMTGFIHPGLVWCSRSFAW